MRRRVVRRRPVAPAAVLMAIAVGAPAAAQQEPPAPLPMADLEFPDFEERTLSSGAGVIIVPQHEQPWVTVNLVLRAGTAYEAAGSEGLAGFTAQLLNKGTASRTALEIAEAVDFMGANLAAGAGLDVTSVTMGALTPDVEPVLELMADIVMNPTFPTDELELIRTQTLTALQLELSQAPAVAARIFARAIYGDHPYGRAPTPESVEALDQAAIAAFHRERYRPDRALFVVAGDIEADAAVALIEDAFTGWTPGAPPASAWPEPERATEREIVLVHKPASVQSSVRIGQLLMEGEAEGWLPIEVANYVLGATSAGRIFTELREEKGWTYGAYSSLARRASVGYFQGNMEVRNEVTDSSVVAMLAHFERIREEPVTAEELADVKSYLTGRFPREIETPQQIASQVADYRVLGLDIEDLESYRSRVSAMEARDLQEAMRAHLDPSAMTVVVVGDATQVMEPLSAVGPITLLDLEGNPLQPADLEVRASDVEWDTGGLEASEWSYQVLFQGNPVGTLDRTLARTGDGGWEMTSALAAGPQTVTQRTAFTDAFEPLEFETSIAAGPQEFGGSVTFQGNRATGSMALPTGEVAIDEEVVRGTLVGEMEEVALWMSELGEGAEVSFPLLSAQSGSTANVTATVVGAEEITVPAGTFQTWRVEVVGAEGTRTIYLRRDAPHILIRQDVAGQPISIQLAPAGGG